MPTSNKAQMPTSNKAQMLICLSIGFAVMLTLFFVIPRPVNTPCKVQVVYFNGDQEQFDITVYGNPNRRVFLENGDLRYQVETKIHSGYKVLASNVRSFKILNQ